MKNMENVKIPQNVTDKPDTSKCDIFDTFSTKNCQFSTFPWDLVRGLGSSCQLVLPVVSISDISVKTDISGQKPQAKPYGRCQNGQKYTKSSVFHGFSLF